MEQAGDFSFERLEVYKRAIQFNDCIFTACDKLPIRLQSSIGDQLRRAALSIVNNIAEGSDKRFSKEKKKFYEYALDSSRECIPMLTIADLRGLIEKNSSGKLREECTVICRMLRRLIQSVL